MMLSRVAVGLATIGLVLASTSSPAGAVGPTLTLATPSVTPDPDPNAYVYCQVVVTSKTPIGISASIVDEAGANVTDFGSGFRASPGVRIPDLYHSEETAGAFDKNGQLYCKAVITGARKKDIVSVDMSLTVIDANGNPTTTVELP